MARDRVTVLTTNAKVTTPKKALFVPSTAIAVHEPKMDVEVKKLKIVDENSRKNSKTERYTAITTKEFAALAKVMEGKIDELSRSYDDKIKHLMNELKNEKEMIKRDTVVSTIFNKTKDFFSQFSTQKILEQYKNVSMWATSTEVDEFGLDPVFTAKAKPFFDLLYEKWWRIQTIGVHNIPKEGRALLVSNHSGGIPIDGAMIVTSVFREHPTKRFVRPLVEDFAYYLPFVSSFLIKTGGVRASQENAQRLLEKDQLVIVFPEGLKGISKPFKYRYKLQRFGRGGYVKLAIKTRSPIIPVAVVGAEEVYPILGTSKMLGKLFGAPYAPITPFFPLLGPIGAIPLPTKWYIEYGEPIDIEKYSIEDADDDILINRLSENIRTRIQNMLINLLKNRKSIFFS